MPRRPTIEHRTSRQVEMRLRRAQRQLMQAEAARTERDDLLKALFLNNGYTQSELAGILNQEGSSLSEHAVQKAIQRSKNRG